MSSEEIKQAMKTLAKVKYRGVIYDRITAYIYRVVESQSNSYVAVLQCELLDKCGNSVVVAEAEKVELM